MPANGFNVGRDNVIDIVTNTGVLRGKIRTGFSAKQETHSLDVKAMDGSLLFDELPAGWSGMLDLERADSAWDDYFSQREEDYYGGLASPTITITQTVSEISGAVSQYRFTGVALKFDDAGTYAGDKTVPQKVAWKAARRRKIA